MCGREQPNHRVLKFQIDRSSALIAALAVKDPQNGQEQVDDIQVERDCRCDLLLDVIMPHDKLGVHKDITGEDQRSCRTVHQFDCLSPREERSHETEDDQDPKRAEEIGGPAGEVVLGLTREDGQEDEDRAGDDERLQDDATVVEAGDDANGICLQSGETGQEEHVGGVAFPLPERQEHEADGAEETGPHRPAVALDPVLVGGAEERYPG